MHVSLMENGVMMAPLVYPSVKPGEERLRLNVTRATRARTWTGARLLDARKQYHVQSGEELSPTRASRCSCYRRLGPASGYSVSKRRSARSAASTYAALVARPISTPNRIKRPSFGSGACSGTNLRSRSSRRVPPRRRSRSGSRSAEAVSVRIEHGERAEQDRDDRRERVGERDRVRMGGFELVGDQERSAQYENSARF